MKITGNKIRAARALLDWSIKDLAARTGMTDAAISNIESGKTASPRQDSIDAIRAALEPEGIVFTVNGVERLQNTVIWLPDYMALLDDALLRRPQEILFMNADDRKSSGDVDDRMRQLHDAGIAFRFLVPATVDYFAGKRTQYRRSSLLAARDVTVIYSGRIGFWTPEGVMVVVSPFLAEDYKKQFEILWDHAEKL